MQKGLPSVQQSIMEAVERFSGSSVLLKGAGRTDAGVHARGQVAHFNLPGSWLCNTVRDAINYHLKPSPISILRAETVDETFDARFSAIGRHYFYRIIFRRSPLALDYGRAWQVCVPLDVEAMRVAAGLLIGRHDFTTFRSVSCQSRSPVKTLEKLEIHHLGDEFIFCVSARSFLHKQVRSMVGMIKLVGERKRSIADVKVALEACDRQLCGSVAPACGLYLMRVDYPGLLPDAPDDASSSLK